MPTQMLTDGRSNANIARARPMYGIGAGRHYKQILFESVLRTIPIR
jgi:hypothetical protein